MIRRSKQLPSFIMALLVASLGWGDARGSQTASRPTIDPEPPLALTVELISLQKNAKGGVASLRLSVKAQMNATEVVVTARVPGKLVFSDGSAQRSWNVSLDESGTASLSTEVIASEDGKFVVSAEVSGSIQGTPVHRGAALKLLVGVREPAPRVKDGAIEYAGSQGGGA
jgi:hypothetical protein